MSIRCRPIPCHLLWLLFISPIPLHAAWVKTSGPGNVRAFVSGSVLVGGISKNSVFAATTAGIYRSTNDGASWVAVNGSGGQANISIRALALSGTSLFAGTDGGGVLRSTNGGEDWMLVNNGLTNLDVRTFYANGSALYVGTSGGGVFRSVDAGMSWSAMSISQTNAPVNAFLFRGSDLYAGTGGGIFTSADGGTTWVPNSTGLSNMNVLSLYWNASYIYAATSDRVYALRLNSFPNPGWKPENLGSVQAPEVRGLGGPPPFTDAYVPLLAGTSGDGLFLEGPGSWTSFNEGLTELDVRVVYFSYPSIFAGTDGGVWIRPVSESQRVGIRFSSPSRASIRISTSGTLTFDLSRAVTATLTAHSLSGKREATLLNENLPAGSYVRQLKSYLPSGLYLYQLKVGDIVETQKVLLTR